MEGYIFGCTPFFIVPLFSCFFQIFCVILQTDRDKGDEEAIPAIPY